MHKSGHHHVFQAVLFLLPFCYTGLWVWKTLGGLFDWPPACLKHMLAVLVVIYILKRALLPTAQLATRPVACPGYVERVV
jgi:hypothetical protein